mmetsp:Transcript_15310/g.20121  ORF Transcript_15310/g.20121 Transcript_15310/m.20121 type:complete len:303 (+) Transcript_15310:154-1062(+)
MTGASKSIGIPDSLTAMMVRFGAPFFSYPFKPIWNRFEGATYEVAYKHFRRDHMGDMNLFLHVLCYVMQLSSNFTVLKYLDESFVSALQSKGLPVPIKSPIALSTTLAWSYELLRTPAPGLAKLLSVSTILLAYKTRGYLKEKYESLLRWQIFFDTLVIHQLLLKKPMSDTKSLLQVFIPRVLLYFLVKRNKNALSSSKGKRRVTKNFLLLHMLISFKPPAFAAPYLFGLYGWILAELTGQEWLYYWSLGYVASLSQGLAHELASEPATLPQLTTVPDELAHTAYFPNLMFQATLQNLKLLQ